MILGVSDGDTVVVDVAGARHTVRLLGINAPEIAHGGQPEQCYGRASAGVLRTILGHGRVDLVTDRVGAHIDRYGRWLRYVELDGQDVGEQLVLAGAAVSYHPRSVVRPTREPAYDAVMEQARVAGRGLWGACPGPPAPP